MTPQAMNPDERRAEILLRSLSLGEIQYEPNGYRTWPDFAIGDELAVEVRRLQQVHRRRGRSNERFEFHSASLEATVRNVLKTFGSGARSWFVNVRITQDISDDERRTLTKALRDFLSQIDDDDDAKQEGKLTRHSAVWTLPAQITFPLRFILTSPPTLNTGGFVVAELKEAIEYCIEDKAAKIRTGYENAWLVLVDHSGLFFDVDDTARAFHLLSVNNPFQRIIVLHSSRDDLIFDSHAASAGGVGVTH